MIMRRFSPHPNQLVYFSDKKSKEAVGRGEFVDIHNIGSLGSDDFDVLTTDITDEILRTEIAEIVGHILGRQVVRKRTKSCTSVEAFSSVKIIDQYFLVLLVWRSKRWPIDTSSPTTFPSTEVGNSPN